MKFAIQHVLQWGERELKSLKNPKLETEVLLASALKCDRTFLKTHPKQKISLVQYILNKKNVQKRKQRIPTAYILGYKNWAGRSIFVNKHVLIPRDETEILCEIISQNPRNRIPKSVLDMGTGSGCIALFLSQKFPTSKIFGIDNSRKALHVARKNTKGKVHLLHSDLFKKFPKGSEFDLIVANLPYVPEDTKISIEVQKEPLKALFGGKDGLNVIRKLKQQIEQKNIHFQELWLEFLPTQQKEIEKIFSNFTTKFFTDCGKNTFFVHIAPHTKY